MTKLGEEYLFDCKGVKRFSRLPISYAKNYFLINHGRNSVVKVQDKKILHNWTLKNPHIFTCPVVFNAEDNTVCCISDNKTLLIWSIEDDTLDSATSIKLPESVYAMVPVTGEKPVLVFHSGKCLRFESVLKEEIPATTASCFRRDEELVWADARSHSSGNICVFYLTVAQIKRKEYRLRSFLIDVSSNTSKFSDQIISSKNKSHLKSWCLNKHTDDSSLLTIWSDAVIRCYQIDSDTFSTLFSIPGVRPRHLLDIDIIDSTHIILAKADSSTKEMSLEVWDTKFSVRYAVKILDASFSNYLQVGVLENCVFLPSNEDLVAVSLKVEKSTLATAMGKCSTVPSKAMEYTWGNNGSLELLSMDCNNTAAEKLCLTTELKVKKLISEGSACLQHTPESELVELLLFSIRKRHQKGDGNAECNSDIILNLIFSASYSDVLLVKHLEKLALDETLILLEKLVSLLEKTTEKVSAGKPTDLQICKWIRLVMQTNYQALYSIKDRKISTFIKRIDEIVLRRMEYYEVLNEIGHLLNIAKKGDTILPIKTVQGKYCVENVYL